MSTPTGRNSADATVIVISFNHAAYIDECLDSIRSQSQPPARVIIADDASTDDSAATIERFLAAHPNFGEFHPNATNIGLTRTLNRMLALVDTPYVTYISADDYMLPTRIERHLALMHAESADLAYSDAIVVDSASRIIHPTSRVEFPWPDEPERSQDVLGQLLVSNWIPAASFFLRTAALHAAGGYNDQIFYEDFELLVRMASLGHTFTYVDDALVAVRRLPTSLGAREFRDTNPRFLIAVHVALGHFAHVEPRLRDKAAAARWEVAKRIMDTNLPRRAVRKLLRDAGRGAGSSLGFAINYAKTLRPGPATTKRGV